MWTERRKVLEMLAEGKISAEDAERLLEKLSASGGSPAGTEQHAGEERSSQGQKPRYLRILVDSPDRNQVNVRVPLSFIRTGVGLAAVLPRRVNEKLIEKGIDLTGLSSLKGDELDQALQELNVDVDARNGKKVRIFCE